MVVQNHLAFALADSLQKKEQVDHQMISVVVVALVAPWTVLQVEDRVELGHCLETLLWVLEVVAFHLQVVLAWPIRWVLLVGLLVDQHLEHLEAGSQTP